MAFLYRARIFYKQTNKLSRSLQSRLRKVLSQSGLFEMSDSILHLKFSVPSGQTKLKITMHAYVCLTCLLAFYHECHFLISYIDSGYHGCLPFVRINRFGRALNNGKGFSKIS